MNNTQFSLLLVSNVLAYLVMLIINILSQFAYLNGMTTAEISSEYINLFTPAGITFAIWSIIYIFMLVFVIYQFIGRRQRLVKKVAPFFLLTCVFNVLWIIAWHYTTPLFSLIAIFLLWLFLWVINDTSKDMVWYIKAGFSIYYAWITIATVASVFVYLSSMNLTKFDSIIYQALTILAILFAMYLAVIKTKRDRDYAYGLTIMWALAGIVIKHLSITGFNGKYPVIVGASIISIIYISIMMLDTLFVKRNVLKTES